MAREAENPDFWNTYPRLVVEQKQAQEWAETNDLEYCEISVKEMENYEVPFRDMANSFDRLYKEKVEIFHSLV
uniref:Uncharacterized protein n=1 Tax=Sphaerodactylus townsendi TaxID=933632 RepID=A0ACB8FN67_9SAUR